MLSIECPQCRKKYSIDPVKYPDKKSLKLKCAKCGHSFLFELPPNNPFPEEKDGTKWANDTTMVGVDFSKEGNTQSYFFPDDCEISLTYRGEEGKEVTTILKQRITVIGRKEGDIIINDPLVSKKHAIIDVKGSSVVELKDLASRNGTFHNDMQISTVFLQSGDIIKVGTTAIHYSNKITL